MHSIENYQSNPSVRSTYVNESIKQQSIKKKKYTIMRKEYVDEKGHLLEDNGQKMVKKKTSLLKGDFDLETPIFGSRMESSGFDRSHSIKYKKGDASLGISINQ